MNDQHLQSHKIQRSFEVAQQRMTTSLARCMQKISVRNVSKSWHECTQQCYKQHSRASQAPYPCMPQEPLLAICCRRLSHLDVVLRYRGLQALRLRPLRLAIAAAQRLPHILSACAHIRPALMPTLSSPYPTYQMSCNMYSPRLPSPHQDTRQTDRAVICKWKGAHW